MGKKYLIFLVVVFIITLLEIVFGVYYVGIKSAKPKIDIIYDTSILDSYIKLQEQYRELQFSYDEFERYLEGYERGAYDGYLKAKGIEGGE